MKKKIFCAILAAALTVSLLGCTNRSADGHSSATPAGVSFGAAAPDGGLRSL